MTAAASSLPIQQQSAPIATTPSQDKTSASREAEMQAPRAEFQRLKGIECEYKEVKQQPKGIDCENKELEQQLDKITQLYRTAKDLLGDLHRGSKNLMDQDGGKSSKLYILV